MKNINEIINEVKANGFDEHETGIQIKHRVTEQAKSLLSDIIDTPQTETKYQDLADALAHLLEIFTPANYKKLNAFDVAEDLQLHVFTYTDFFSTGYFKWREKLFGEKFEPMQKTSDALDLLSIQLSEVLNNPNLPPKLYEIITDEFDKSRLDLASPEHIKHNLLNNEWLREE